ncbi:hypothetical protein DFH07DRAFT_468760 [Mycena maculata]|uniref:NAD(P)-binding domain-containing protein n=1 Tax=Mycena maculata TaxID=230809 RepID=A0AAD7K852_9AGAR|nr:hypothetical protein DFH07DRAFT_468760 [Mycena maculata]
MSVQTALVLGATGQVGGALLKELLASPHFTRVGEFGRRNTSLESLSTGKDKLEQKTIDFEKLDVAGLRDSKWDVVFISLGTTAKAAGSPEAFERIDREYVINAAKAAKSDHPQKLIYVSSSSADSKSRFLYLRSKGLTEEGLASLGYEETIVFRPGLLTGVNRPGFRLGESMALAVSGVFSHFSSSLDIKITTLAKSLVLAGQLGAAGLPAVAGAKQAGKDGARFTVIGNAGAVALAKEFKS